MRYLRIKIPVKVVYCIKNERIAFAATENKGVDLGA